jgi:tripartite-type tricarboxylate transporter receptor subunit TctC
VGGGPAITAVVSGETAVYGAPLSTALPHIRQGRLRPLGLTTSKRLALLPDYPTVAETIPGYEFNAWAGLLVPAKTPKEMIAAIHTAMLAAMKKPDVARRLSDLGYIVVGSQPEELAAYIKIEIEKMAKLIRDNGLTAR